MKYKLKSDKSELVEVCGVATAGAAHMLHIEHHTSKLTTHEPQIECKRQRTVYISAIDTRAKAIGLLD